MMEEMTRLSLRYSRQAAKKKLQPEAGGENRRTEAGTDYSEGAEYNYVYDEALLPDIGDFDHDHRLVGGRVEK